MKTHLHIFYMALLLFSNLLFSQNKIALVIGNGSYSDVPLRNPVNDATDMANTLTELGFNATLKTNLNQQQLEDAIRAFEMKIASGDIALFYFSGHGVQVDGLNYLVPVGAGIQAENEVRYKCTEAGLVLDKMESAGSGMNIIILDACRDNPFKGVRSGTKGFAQMSAPTGSIISYSTAPGSVAMDGDSRNSPYTRNLIDAMKIQGLKIEDVFKKERNNDAKETANRQIPWESSSLMNDFYFKPGFAIYQTQENTSTIYNLPTDPKSDFGIELVFVKGGAFTMGCTREQTDCEEDEKPAHKVTVDDFYIGKYEVTQKQWSDVMGTSPSAFKKNEENCPVELVDWNEIQDFIKKLNQKTNKNYRLSTEAEWEYAARGGNKGRGTKYSGSNNLDEVGWYSGNSSRKTYPVGQKKANELGLYDMTGNVWEWCSDWYGSDYYKNSPQNNPMGPSTGSHRVMRGGSLRYYHQNCRVSFRDFGDPDDGRNCLGFRLAQDN
jgi:formylglycine-generating enzyme required for sulfatase activity